MTVLSGYALETLREGGEFTLYRGWQHGNPLPVLVLTPVAEQPTPASLKQLEHEYSLAAELEPAWAARPLALARHQHDIQGKIERERAGRLEVQDALGVQAARYADDGRPRRVGDPLDRIWISSSSRRRG